MSIHAHEHIRSLANPSPHPDCLVPFLLAQISPCQNQSIRDCESEFTEGHSARSNQRLPARHSYHTIPPNLVFIYPFEPSPNRQNRSEAFLYRLMHQTPGIGNHVTPTFETQVWGIEHAIFLFYNHTSRISCIHIYVRVNSSLVGWHYTCGGRRC